MRFGFLNDRFRLENVADENAGRKRDDGHQDVVGNEIKEVKERHAEHRDRGEDAVAEAGEKP